MNDIKSAILKKFSMVLDLMEDEESLESLKIEIDKLFVVTKMIKEIGDNND